MRRVPLWSLEEKPLPGVRGGLDAFQGAANEPHLIFYEPPWLIINLGQK